MRVMVTSRTVCEAVMGWEWWMKQKKVTGPVLRLIDYQGRAIQMALAQLRWKRSEQEIEECHERTRRCALRHCPRQTGLFVP